MKCIRIGSSGTPSVLEFVDVEIPQPTENQLRVRIEAAGVNYIDVLKRNGRYPQLMPWTPGGEAAGVVDAVGPGAESQFAVGDRVVSTSFHGAYAEYALVDAEAAIPVPDGIDGATAAAALLQGMTAQYLTFDVHPVGTRDVVAIPAASGGVGHLLTQWCLSSGATVIAATSNSAKERHLRSVGVECVVRYDREDWADGIKRFAPEGASVIFDGVGASTFDAGLTAMSRRGHMVIFGEASGPLAPVETERLSAQGSVSLTRTRLVDYIPDRATLLARAQAVFEAITGGRLSITIHHCFPLQEASTAHRTLENRESLGKVLITPHD